jgi:Animal haem peroxidase
MHLSLNLQLSAFRRSLVISLWVMCSGCPVHTLVVHPTRNAAANTGETAYLNTRTGWWDASFLYGQTEAAVLETRAFQGGKLKEDTDMDGVPIGNDGSPSVGDQVCI